MRHFAAIGVLGLLVSYAAPAAADVDVYVQNNTERTLAVRPVWGSAPRSDGPAAIAPGARARVLSIVKPGSGKEHSFETEVDVGGWVLVLRQRVATRGLLRRQSLSFAVDDGSWLSGSESRRSWRAMPDAPSGGVLVDVAGYPAPWWRTTDVVEYVVHEESPRPDAAGDGALSVLSWNVMLLPRLISWSNQAERARRVPAVARGYDVLVLSELFDDGVREDLVRALRAEYPYSTRVVDGRRWTLEDGGVVILSRWPIEREAVLAFATRGRGTDRLSSKGVVYACVRKGERRHHVFGTHLQSGGADAAPTRAAQLAELRAFVDAQGIPGAEPVLVAGDLNVGDWRDPDGRPTGELAQMLTLLRADLPAERAGGLTFSYDAELNALAGHGRATLDYVLWLTDHARPRASSAAVRLHRAIDAVTVHGRAVWDLSDHFPIEAVYAFDAPPPPAPPGPTMSEARGVVDALGPR